MQFDNIYNAKYSNLKKELKLFNNGKGIKELSKHEEKINARKARKMLAKHNKGKYSSFTESTFQKLSQKVNSSLFNKKLLNKSKAKNQQVYPESSRIRHKYTKSEPHLLMGLKFQKALNAGSLAYSGKLAGKN